MSTPCAAGLWFVDFEYRQPPGERPHVWCMSAREYHTGQEVRLWRDDLVRLHRAPFDTETTIMCAYAVEAEAGCFRSLNWPMPRRALDLYVEFHWLVNGQRPASGFGLIGALTYFGLGHISVKEKQDLRDEAQTRIDWPQHRRLALMDYCASDTAGLAALFRAWPTRLIGRGLSIARGLVLLLLGPRTSESRLTPNSWHASGSTRQHCAIA
jgi:hypothetical protein